MGELERNAAAVGRYLEIVHHKVERAIVGSEEPYDRKSKGSSRPPMSEPALLLAMKNRHASKILEPLLHEMRHRADTWNGIRFSELLEAVRYDPAAARNWRRKRTEEESAKAEAWWKMCVLLARTAQARWHKAELTAPDPDDPEKTLVVKDADSPLDLSRLVITDHKDEEAGNPKKAAARDREADKKNQHEEAKRARVRHIREIQQREKSKGLPHDEESAMRLWTLETGMSYATACRAMEFVKGLSRESTDGESYRLSSEGKSNGDGEAA
jgi:hypothetical protein